MRTIKADEKPFNLDAVATERNLAKKVNPLQEDTLRN